METVPEIRQDFGLFMKSIPQEDYLLTFWEFIKIFLWGDIYALMRTSPFAASRSPAEYLDPEFQEDHDLRHKYFGDPVKRAMFVQSLRRWPYMTAIPVIFSLSIFIGSLLKLTIPFIKRLSLMMEGLLMMNNDEEEGSRGKRDVSGLQAVSLVPGHLRDICRTLARSLEAAEYLAVASAHKEGAFRLETPRHSTLYSNHTEKSAKDDLHHSYQVGQRVLSWMKGWNNLTPSLAKCGDQILRCHVKLSRRWRQHGDCLGADRKSECASLLGRFFSVITNGLTASGQDKALSHSMFKKDN